MEKICKDLGLFVDRFTPDSVEGLTENVDFKEGRGTEKSEDLVAVCEGVKLTKQDVEDIMYNNAMGLIEGVKADVFGRSETMTIKDGILDGGEFAHIYFVDWDHVRARYRQFNVTVMGTTEDVEDRKWNKGETINTLRKYTDEEKAYGVHYDLQLER